MDEVQNIILQVKGAEELKRLTALLEEEKGTLAKLLTLKQSNPAGMDPASIQRSASAVAAFNSEIRTLEGSLDELEEKGGGFKMRGGMRADLILTHAFRELASETATATEKLERMTMVMPWVMNMFGVGGPWMMGVTLGATAVVELINHWNELLSVLGNSAPLEAAKHLEALKAAADEAAEAFTKMVEAPTSHEEVDIKRTRGMLAGPAGRTAQDAIAAALAATGTGETMTGPELREMQMAAKHGGSWRAKADENRERIRRANIARAQAMLGLMTSGKTRQERDEARLAVAGLAQAQPGLFPAGFGADIEQPPATREEQQALEVQGRANARKMRLEMERDKREQHAQDARNRHDERRNLAHGEAEAEREAEHQAALEDKDMPKVGDAARARANRARRRHAAQLAYAQQGVERETRANNLPFDAGMMHDVATHALSNFQGGMTEQAALFTAIESKLKTMEHMAEQFNGLMVKQARIFGGPDTSANFSQMTPFIP